MLSVLTNRIFTAKIFIPYMVTSIKAFSINTASYSQSKLAALRKKTGLPIMKCKEALQNYDNIEKAEEWLEEQAHKDGLVRVCLDRKMPNGAVALSIRNSNSNIFRMALIELKCETDHLSRSARFNELTAELCQSLLESPQSSPLIQFNSEELEIIQDIKGQCFKDILTSFIGLSKENITIQRGLLYEGVGLVGSYVHNVYKYSNDTRCGTHAGIFHGKSISDEINIDQSVLDRMSQHIVGMNPLGENPLNALKTQEWLFDSEKTVESILHENSLECIAYFRYEISK